MKFKIKNGLNVCDEGTIIINGVKHYVKNGFVACDSSLNRMAWNVTEFKTVCPVCAKFINRDSKPIQLSLNF